LESNSVLQRAHVFGELKNVFESEDGPALIGTHLEPYLLGGRAGLLGDRERCFTVRVFNEGG